MTKHPDFVVHNHGTVWRIRAVSDAAKIFAEENFGVEDWQGEPENFLTDWRPARDLCLSLQAGGFTVQGA